MSEFSEFTNPLSADYDIKTAIKSGSEGISPIPTNNGPVKKEDEFIPIEDLPEDIDESVSGSEEIIDLPTDDFPEDINENNQTLKK